jgi:hypothetical protein
MEEEFKQEGQMEEEQMEEEKDHLLPEQTKWMIVHYKKKDYSNKETARKVGAKYERLTLSHQTVKAVWKKYLETNKVENQWNREGRPFVLDDEDLDDLYDFFKRNPKKSVSEAKVALNLPVTRQTINTVLLEKGLKAYRAPKKFYVTAANIQKRLEFATKYERLTLNYWRKVLFSDESSFSLISSNGRIQVRRTKEESNQEYAIQYKAQQKH